MAKINREQAQEAIRSFLSALGYEGDLVAEAPERVTAAFADELLVGRDQDVATLIQQGSEPALNSEVVLLTDIEVMTVCPHHLMVARGVADVAYIPGDLVLGLGTLCRVIEAETRRLTLQEAIAPNVVDALMNHAGAQGAYLRLQLDHGCLQARGPRQAHAQALTWAARGKLSDNAELAVVLQQISQRGRVK